MKWFRLEGQLLIKIEVMAEEGAEEVDIEAADEVAEEEEVEVAEAGINKNYIDENRMVERR